MREWAGQAFLVAWDGCCWMKIEGLGQGGDYFTTRDRIVGLASLKSQKGI